MSRGQAAFFNVLYERIFIGLCCFPLLDVSIVLFVSDVCMQTDLRPAYIGGTIV